MATLVRRTWHGDEIVARSRRANGRAVIGMGEQASREMKGASHQVSGDLRRSIHAAKVGTMGTIEADGGTVLERPTRVALEVGSWLPYACVENNRGGAHRFADIGWQLAAPRRMPTLQRAWREEGL